MVKPNKDFSAEDIEAATRAGRLIGNVGVKASEAAAALRKIPPPSQIEEYLMMTKPEKTKNIVINICALALGALCLFIVWVLYKI